jgi:hypothetical protein
MADETEHTIHTRNDVEVTHNLGKVSLKTPTSDTTLTPDEAQTLASRLLENAALANGDDPIENDWVRIPMQYLRVFAERLPFSLETPDDDAQRVPAPNSDEPDGHTAEVHCWIKDQTQSNAMHIAAGCVAEHGWMITEVLEHEVVSRTDFAETDLLPYYEQALVDSEVFLYEIEEANNEGSDDA